MEIDYSRNFHDLKEMKNFRDYQCHGKETNEGSCTNQRSGNCPHYIHICTCIDSAGQITHWREGIFVRNAAGAVICKGRNQNLAEVDKGAGPATLADSVS